MEIYLLMTAAVILACVAVNRLSGKLGVPALLAFILLGMLFGSDGLVKIPFEDYAFAESICSTALIFIMFYGGFGTKWSTARPVAAQAVLLSTAGVAVTAALVGVFCRFALGMTWEAGMLTGAVIGSTDAASVFSILRSRRLSLKYNTASLLELESGSNDPFSYMLTAIVLSVINGSAGGIKTAYMIFSQVVYGAAGGVVLAVLSVFLLKRAKFSTPGFDAVCVFALALLSYAAPAAVGGNGYLSAYIVGIVLGNSDIKNKKTLVPFFDGITGLMQMLIFFLLGLLSFPSSLPGAALPALAVFLFITFAARPVAVFLLLAPFKNPGGGKIRRNMVISWAGFRGASSIVFAVMAMMGADIGNGIFNMVLCIVLFSILLQGWLLPAVSAKLGMIDEEGDVMKTFSDYTKEVPVDFIRFSIKEGHSWCGASVKDIILPPDTLLVLLKRGDENIVPNGGTVLAEGDILILSARSSGIVDGAVLSEKQIEKDSPEAGKRIGEVRMGKNELIILIMRGDNVIIPNGGTVLEENDILVINSPGS